ncbi:Aspartic proteinase PCS1 [Acorus calamus]|uniref:Aspartic proteinase PCS1 n=1 Tax=Acorus calamus TaxID=4465 RepID=A0AAV9CVT1_ACOCL|nr:Aspartic proteinase PCS1 [Acorus calamus]
MSMASSLPLLLLLLLLPISTLSGPNPHCTFSGQGSPNTLPVMHVFSPCSPFRPAASKSWEDTMLELDSEDKARLVYLSNLAVSKKSIVPLASGRQLLQTTTYIVRANVGTPPQPMLVSLDTSNDAAWFPCTGCFGCSSSTVFAPAKSTTYRTVPCKAAQCAKVPNPTCGGVTCAFNMTYGSSTFQAALSQDSLALAADVVPSYTFGTHRAGPGLMSQTQALYKSTFSYCLPSYKSLNFSGSLKLGPAGQPIRIKYTPLLTNPRRPSLYYVNLVGIRVGRRVVAIPPKSLAFDPATGAGTVIDSGTAFTRLVAPVYTAVRDEFRRRVRGTVTTLGGFDTCYNGPVVVPTITFMFAGMNMTLAEENVMIHSTAGSISCLAMASAPDNVNNVLNVIATMQQQNHRVVFDVPNSRLGVSQSALAFGSRFPFSSPSTPSPPRPDDPTTAAVTTKHVMARASPLFLVFLSLGFFFATYNLLILVIRYRSDGPGFGFASARDPVVGMPEGRKMTAAFGGKRMPFHVALTATDAPYSRWQCRIMYYWYKQVRGLPGSEMGGFTRILHNGREDHLMEEIPTVVVDPLPAGLDRVSVVSVSLDSFRDSEMRVASREKDSIVVSYILMAEPDHVFVKPLPNLARGGLPAAFPFFYIKPTEHVNIIRKFYPEEKGEVTDIDPIGNSPVIIKKSDLEKIAPTWLNISLSMKDDPETDKAFGWVLEMYAYAVASALHKVQHVLRKDFMIQGELTYGKIGEWRFDKRSYLHGPIPRNLSMPPSGVPESVVTLVKMVNEATANIPGWDDGR